MIWIRLLIAMVLLIVCGVPAVGLFSGHRARVSLFERLFFAFGIGAGMAAYWIFLAGVAGVRFSVPLITAALLITAIVLLAACYLSPARQETTGGPVLKERMTGLKTLLAATLIVWGLWKLTFVFFGGLYLPIVSQDAWWNWSSGAKVFYYNRGLLLDPSGEHFFGSGYRPFLSYPLLNPLLQVWISLMLGGFHEALAKAWAPVYFTGCIALVYYTVKREGGFYVGLLAAFFLSAAPLITYHALDAYSDLPMAFYVLAGSVFLWRYMEGNGAGNTVLAGLFFSMAAFTKNEGIVYLAGAGCAIAAYNIFEKRRDWRSILYFLIPTVLYIGPWLLFKAHYGIGFGHGTGRGIGTEDITGGFVWAQKVHLEVIPVFFKELFFTINHGLIFPFLAVISILGFKTIIRSNIKYLYLIILLMAAVFLFNYTATYDYRYALNRSGINRNALTFLPLAFLIAGLLASRLVGRSAKGG